MRIVVLLVQARASEWKERMDEVDVHRRPSTSSKLRKSEIDPHTRSRLEVAVETWKMIHDILMGYFPHLYHVDAGKTTATTMQQLTVTQVRHVSSNVPELAGIWPIAHLSTLQISIAQLST